MVERMGKAARRKLQARLARLEAALFKEQSKKVPWWESNLLWGSLGLSAAIILTVVAAMVRDLRWMLWLAWACSWLTIWAITRNFSSRWMKRGVLACGITVIGLGLLGLNIVLEPKPEAKPQGPHPMFSISCGICEGSSTTAFKIAECASAAIV